VLRGRATGLPPDAHRTADRGRFGSFRAGIAG